MHKRDITIVVVTSVLPSHPNTDIIDETIKSIRFHFPDNEIIMQIDGLRREHLLRKKDYDEYKNVLPMVFESHIHQTGMMRLTMPEIKTSLLLYVEGDTPLTLDPIDWEKCLDMIEYGKANTIRFHFEAFIPEPHEHLMFGLEDGFLKTAQWSQRPHLTTKSYYRDIVLPSCQKFFFIEDTFHGRVQDDILPYNIFNEDGWSIHKLWIYHPDVNIKRSYHLDGRDGHKKFTTDDNFWGYKE